MPSEKDTAIGALLQKVLSWNVHVLHPQKEKLKQVPLFFKDAQSYIETFEPLLLEECRAQILRSLDDTEESCPPALTRVRYEGDVGDFFIVGLAFSNESLLEKFHENDLFMLCTEHPSKVFSPTEVPGEEMDDDTKQAQANGNWKIEDMTKNPQKYYHLIGSIEQIEQGGIRGKFYLGEAERDARIRSMSDELRYDRDWWVFKLCNLSTLQREYTALYTSKSFPLMQTIATGDCRNENKDTKNEISEPLQRAFENMYNEFQMNALHLALSGHKVSLIQGPPGTGKTHVICGIMSVLLHAKTVNVTKAEEAVKEYKPSPLSDSEKRRALERAQPWLYESNYACVRDDFTLHDRKYETDMEKKRREIKLKPNEVVPAAPKHARRILLCAPSNGAVDEIVNRLMTNGLLNADGIKYIPSIVRVGPGAHKDVSEVTLDTLARSKLGTSSGANPSAAGFHQSTTKSSNIPLDMNGARTAVLLDANIVATTLSFSGSSVLSKIPGFDYVIIDEAAQAVETSTLIPLQHKCKGLILVGDPKQLPATIISKVALDYKYDQSMFQRLMESSKSELCMLRTQYRMHPSIRQFPSQHFYENRLEDAPSLITDRVQDYHMLKCFGPFMFYDLRDTFETQSSGGSVYNETEANFILDLFKLLVKMFPDKDMQNRVGVICPYRQQVLKIKELFKDFPTVNVDTVDGYQGREKEFIIFSCVRAPKEDKSTKPAIGFLADVRRMNVALTRPRCSLLVVGNSKSLKSNADWRALVNYSVEANSYIRVKPTMVEDLANNDKFTELQTKAAQEHNTALAKRQAKAEKRAALEAAKAAEGGEKVEGEEVKKPGKGKKAAASKKKRTDEEEKEPAKEETTEAAKEDEDGGEEEGDGKRKLKRLRRKK